MSLFDGEGGALPDAADDGTAFDDSDIMAGVVDEGTGGTGVDAIGLFAVGATAIMLSFAHVAAPEDNISIAGASDEAFISLPSAAALASIALLPVLPVATGVHFEAFARPSSAVSVFSTPKLP